MNRLWIKQARLIDPSSGTDQMGDLLEIGRASCRERVF